MSGRRAVRVSGGHHPVLLRCGALLRLRTRGSDRNPHHPGEPLLQDHHGPCHADGHVSAEEPVNVCVCIYTLSVQKKVDFNRQILKGACLKKTFKR